MSTYCVTFNTTCSSLAYGCYLYTDYKKTVPVSSGWVSDGTNVYSVNSSGMITSVTSCSSCQPYGTYINQICLGGGFDLYNAYADGNCDLYYTIEQYNSVTCGYSGGGGYSCDCGFGCGESVDPCYYNACFDCNNQV
jgi:hypothetical protein